MSTPKATYSVTEYAAFQDGYDQAMRDAADKLHEVASWCRANGFPARARHTDSAARRVAGECACLDVMSGQPGRDIDSRECPVHGPERKIDW